nr:agmatinase mitochondrial-like [Hymenolepis microstoma]
MDTRAVTLPSSVGLIEAAINKGQPKEGVEKAPKEIRSAGLDHLINSLNAKVSYYGEVRQPEDREPDIVANCLNQRALIKATLELTELVEKSVAENEITLIIGGDHSSGIGAIEGHFKAFPDSFVVWVDAHGDINTPDSSVSKHTHGMPVSFVMRETYKQIPHTMGFEKIQPVLDPNQIIYIGLRDLDPPELNTLKEFSVPYFSMDDVRQLGIEKVLETTLRIIEKTKPHCKIHLSFDIDSLDPKFAPSTGTPVPGGLTLKEGKYICRTLAQTGQLRSMLMAEVNTALGSEEDAKMTLSSANEILKSALLLD